MNDFSFYFRFGWEHIISIEAIDHILFIAALSSIYLVKDWKKVLLLITAFTAGHTITLVLSSNNLVEVDSRIVEILIPCTILFTAITNLIIKSFTPKLARINYVLALVFGLIHGLAFANVLRMILASDQSFALSMFSFSIGLELGQILIVFLMLLLAYLFVEILKLQRRNWVFIISVVVLGFAIKMIINRWQGS